MRRAKRPLPQPEATDGIAERPSKASGPVIESGRPGASGRTSRASHPWVGDSIRTLKIATFNINNVNRRLANLLAWLAQARPDVVCLQELKATQEAFPARALRDAGYGAVWQGERSWNGVAILARGGEPVITRRALPGDGSDRQARYIEAALAGILVGCLYLPNGNPQPGPKFDYKLAWLERLIAHAGACSTRAGSMRFAPVAPSAISKPSGTTSAIAGGATPG